MHILIVTGQVFTKISKRETLIPFYLEAKDDNYTDAYAASSIAQNWLN